MISYGYLIRILRGLYYVKTLEEFTLKKPVDVHKALSLAMEELKVKCYFGYYRFSVDLDFTWKNMIVFCFLRNYY